MFKNGSRFLMLGLFFLGLTGCAGLTTKYEPKGTDDSLVVGVTSFKIEANSSGDSVNLYGEHTNGIKVGIKQVGSNKIFTFTSTGSDGLVVGRLQPGQYEVIRFSIEKENKKGRTSRTITPGNTVKFSVTAGEIVSIGSWDWTLTKYGETDVLRNQRDVRSLFEARYPESLWLERKWNVD